MPSIQVHKTRYSLCVFEVSENLQAEARKLNVTKVWKVEDNGHSLLSCDSSNNVCKKLKKI